MKKPISLSEYRSPACSFLYVRKKIWEIKIDEER